MALYTKIIQAWDEAGYDIQKPPHLMAKEELARKLEEQLAERFKEPIQMYNDGLLAASELLQKLCYEAYKE